MRQKLVFSDAAEVAHLWAHQRQEEAKNARHNFYFYGRTIYSYGSHYPIARLFDKPDDELGTKHLVLFNDCSSSNTTERHKSLVRQAIPFTYTICRVPNPNIREKDFRDHALNVNAMLTHLQELADKQLRARTADYTNEQRTTALSIISYCDWFRVRTKVLESKEIRKDRKRILRQLLKDGLLGQFFKDLKEQAEVNRKRTLEANKKAKEKEYKTLEEWKQGKLSLGAVAHLRTGQAYLRVIVKGTIDDLPFQEKVIQTSQGMELSYRDCETAFVFIQKIKERGIDWRSNGQRLKIDSWNVDSISSQGNVVAGCHRVFWSEIERIAKQEKWI